MCLSFVVFGDNENDSTMKITRFTLRSHSIYGSQVGRPDPLKGSKNLEQMQRRAAKFILQDSTPNYRERLICLELLPLFMRLELQDILFW